MELVSDVVRDWVIQSRDLHGITNRRITAVKTAVMGTGFSLLPRYIQSLLILLISYLLTSAMTIQDMKFCILTKIKFHQNAKFQKTPPYGKAVTKAQFMKFLFEKLWQSINQPVLARRPSPKLSGAYKNTNSIINNS